MKRCMIRIYTEEDFLARWRQYFCDKLGFSTIPDNTRDPSASNVPDPVNSAIECAAYLRREGVSNAQFAQELGVSKALVSFRLSGKRRWTVKWRRQVAFWIATRDPEEV